MIAIGTLVQRGSRLRQFFFGLRDFGVAFAIHEEAC